MKRIMSIALLLFCLLSRAQTWQRLVDNPFNFGGAQAYGIRVIDDTIYVSSAFVVSDTVSNTRAVITKHDINNGDLLDYRQFKSDSIRNSVFNSLYVGHNQLYDTEDDLIHLPISFWSEPIGEAVNKPQYLQIDRGLNVVNSFPIEGYEGDFFTTFNGTRIGEDGNILFYGSRSTVENNIAVADSANTMLVKMTLDGEQLWKNRCSDSFEINSLETLSDGDLIFNCEFVEATYQNKKQIIKTNPQGVEDWRFTFGGYYTSAKSVMVETSDGKIVLANSWNYFYVNEPGSDWWYRVWLQFQKIEDLGSTYTIEQDIKYAPTRNVLDAYGIEEMANGNLLTWGITQNTGGDTYDTVNQIWTKPTERGFLMMLNSDLDSLWFRTYYHPDDDILQMHSEYLISDVAPLEDGGFVTSGWGDIREEGNLHKVWLMRLDEYGCLEPGCHTVAVNEIVVGFENSMLVYPNPVRDFCTLAWSLEDAGSIEKNFNSTELVITDTQGREVYRSPIPNFGQNYQMQLDVSSYSSGLYYAHWVSGSTWLDTVSIVVE